jgi:hypothetical protein
MSLLSAGSISLDSTFKQKVVSHIYLSLHNFFLLGNIESAKFNCFHVSFFISVFFLFSRYTMKNILFHVGCVHLYNNNV